MIQAFGLTSNPRKAHPPAVDDVSFEARAGHVTVLLGGAGAGKTTALRLMLELQQGRGITYFRGRPLHRIAHPAREVGVLLGDVPGHPARSVRGHLRMLCAASGVSARRADEVLEVVGLVSLRDERLGTLSRGMDRRLGLACALLSDPHTLVLDAPAQGLSAREAEWLHGTLRAHAGQGGTVLFTTADSKEAARTADRVVTLDSGRLVADQDVGDFARTRLRPRVAVRTPHAGRLAALLSKEARTARRSVEVVREGGNRLSVYGSTTADVGETAFRHGILIHQLADEVGDMGSGPDEGAGGDFARNSSGQASDEPSAEREGALPGASLAEPDPTTLGLPTAEQRASGAEPAAAPSTSALGSAGVAVSSSSASLDSTAATVPSSSVLGSTGAVVSTTSMHGSAGVQPGASTFGAAAARTVAVSGSSAPEQAAAVSPLSMSEQAVGMSGSSASERAVAASGSCSSEQAGVTSVIASEEPGAAAAAPVPPVPSAGERRATPFGFSAEGRPSAPADTSTPRQPVLGVSAGEGPSEGERRQTIVTEQPSPGETYEAEPGTEPTGAVPPASAGGVSPADGTSGLRGTAPCRAEADGAEKSGEGAVPAEALGEADRTPTTDSDPTPDTPDTGPAVQEPQTGRRHDARTSRTSSSPAAGISALRARLPGARKPGTRQPWATDTARPDGARALDPLSPLPPPISVRPAPSPLRPLRYEIRRATGIGVGFLTCGAVLVVSALIAVVLARIGHTPQARLFAAWPRELPLPPAALAAGLLGALAFGDEFRHPALAADRGTVPRRLGLLTAKLLVSGATAATLAFLTAGCDAEALYVVYGRELTKVPGDWLVLTASWFGLVVGCAWAGVLAAGVFRSTAGGLAAVLAVPVVVSPLVQKAMEDPVLRMAAGLPARMRDVMLLQWPFGGERYLLGTVRVLAQPVGGALVLSVSALLCAYLFTSLRTRLR